MASWPYLFLGAAIVASTTAAADTTSIQTTTPALASNSTITSALPSSPTTAPQSPGIPLEVDVIYPLANQTYNITASLPIIFAVRNISHAAAELGNFAFWWQIMEWGNIGQPVAPSGLWEDDYQWQFTPETAPEDLWIAVNQTDIQKWIHGPRYPYGTTYALQWGMTWYGVKGACGSDPGGNWSNQMLFNVDIKTGVEPELKNLSLCPQFGAAMEVNPAATAGCAAVGTPVSTGDPCVVAVDQAMVTSLSSEWQGLLSASAAASYESTHPTTTSSRSAAPTCVSVPLGLLLIAGVLI